MQGTKQAKQPALEAVIKRPEECTGHEIGEFARLVMEGGQVDAKDLKQTIMTRASRLAFAFDGEHPAGVAAVKQPARHYVLNVFKKANSPNNAANYLMEIAWCCTDPDFRRRGISRLLVGRLLEDFPTSNFFATTAAGNEPMLRIFRSFGFETLGLPFDGRTEPIRLLTRKVNTNEKYDDGWKVRLRAAVANLRT